MIKTIFLSVVTFVISFGCRNQFESERIMQYQRDKWSEEIYLLKQRVRPIENDFDAAFNSKHIYQAFMLACRAQALGVEINLRNEIKIWMGVTLEIASAEKSFYRFINDERGWENFLIIKSAYIKNVNESAELYKIATKGADGALMFDMDLAQRVRKALYPNDFDQWRNLIDSGKLSRARNPSAHDYDSREN